MARLRESQLVLPCRGMARLRELVSLAMPGLPLRELVSLAMPGLPD